MRFLVAAFVAACAAPPSALAQRSADPCAIDDSVAAGPGREIRVLMGTEGVTIDLQSMAGTSDDVLVGTLTECRSYLTSTQLLSGRIVRSVYGLRVDDVLKGGARAGESVTLVVRGGYLGLDGGRSIETRFNRFTHPRVGSRYVLFLTRVKLEVLVPELAGHAGPAVQPNPRHLLYSVFELRDGRVQPNLQSDARNVAGANRGRSAAEFLSDVRAAIGR